MLGEQLGQTAMFQDGDPEELITELRNGALVTITRKHVEEGSHPTAGANKIRYAKDFYAKDKRMMYLAKSAFHKEIRIGNESRAWGFARLMERVKPGEPRRYLRKIMFEETRNLDLLWRWRDGTELRDLVRLACRSVKDWELKWDKGWYTEAWLRAQVELGGNWYENDWPIHYDWPTDVEGLTKKLLQEENFEEIFRMLVAAGICGGDGKITRAAVQGMRGPLLNAAIRRRPDIKEALLMCHSPQNDELSAVLAIIDGRWDDEAIGYHEAKKLTKIDLPQMENYVFDCHTWVGKAWLERVGGGIAWNEAQPGKLDLRWSGAEAGSFWRYLAMEQFGRIVGVKWEDVVISDEHKDLWNKAVGKVY